ncbi:hypothetical protein MYX82_10550 [Acidobacteria bacterium AH-259-D05]|nr:hypothetical protein [Acidobacteria bacterium AH-259-D05]
MERPHESTNLRVKSYRLHLTIKNFQMLLASLTLESFRQITDKGETMKEESKKDSGAKASENEKQAPVKWELTKQDKAFLRSCSIRPD